MPAAAKIRIRVPREDLDHQAAVAPPARFSHRPMTCPFSRSQ
jgi:hypothetical protein